MRAALAAGVRSGRQFVAVNRMGTSRRPLMPMTLLSLLLMFDLANGAGVGSDAAEFPRDVPMFPWVEQAPFSPDHPTTTGDTLSPNMQAAIQYQSKLNPGVTAAGAVVLMCWLDIEPEADHWTFSGRSVPSSLEQLSNILRPDQTLIIGIRGGTCAPSWLTQFDVPMPEGFMNQWARCQPMALPASFTAQYVERYLRATQALWNALKGVRLKQDPRQTLQDRVIAIRNGAMVSSTSGEMGIYSQGCKRDGIVRQSQYDVASIWARNGYTPRKAQAAYASVLKGIFKIVDQRPTVAVSQSVLARDQYGFPLVDDAGVPYSLPPGGNAGVIVPMFAPMMNGAARRYGTRVIFGFNELARKGAPDTLAPAANVIEAGAHGAGIEWQLNGNGRYAPGGPQVTSCDGRHDAQPASVACFNEIMNYATSSDLVPAQSNGGHVKWVEFWPLDAVGPAPMF